jgi:eukaryotic-like serine/threonine-protein kinase
VSRDDQAESRAKWASSAKELLGKVVGGKYKVERILGRGGMGTIYVAEQQPLGRKVALKVLHSNLGDPSADPEFQKRFLLEAATLSNLAHPNIVVVHDYGSLDDEHASCFMVMELLDGRTINQALNEEGRFDAMRSLRIAREISRALRAAHQQNVIHRDLKPSNAMLIKGAEGELVKVLDFGLVKVLRDDSEELTAEGRFLGSPRYMSPEQIQRLPMDGRADLYSLGVILYRMLCGEVPFAGDHAVQTLMAHLSKPPPRMETATGVHVPPAIESIVVKLLEKDPNQRYANADELIRAIDMAWPQISDEPLSVSGEHARPTSAEISATSLPQIVGRPSLSPGTAQAAPAPARATERRWLLPLVIGLGVIAGVASAATVAAILGGDDGEVHEVVIGTQDVAPEPVLLVVPVPPEPDVVPTPPEPGSHTFTLHLRSDPPGATVVREGVEVGQTPADIVLDSHELERAPAVFTLRMRGRAPLTIEQGPSAGDVTIDRQLARVGSRPRNNGHDEPRGANLSIKTAR